MSLVLYKNNSKKFFENLAINAIVTVMLVSFFMGMITVVKAIQGDNPEREQHLTSQVIQR